MIFKMKKKYLFVSYIILLVSHFSFGKKCLEPSEEELEKMLKRNIKENFDLIDSKSGDEDEGIIFFGKTHRENFRNNVKELDHHEKITDSIQCSIPNSSVKISKDSEAFHLCPHILRDLTNRPLRYPRTVQYAECLCKDCLYKKELFNEIDSRCEPVKYAQPGKILNKYKSFIFNF
jgi:hypothetical protein